MYISGINYESIVDGEGVRAVIFISGCKHNCPHCQSPQTHSFTYGKEVTPAFIAEIKSEINKRPFLSGITLSGGDCMFSPSETIELIQSLDIPNNNIWCFTGFTFEEILNDAEKRKLLKYIDVLVDGKFDYAKRDITLLFRGSSNQRLIDVQSSLKENKTILWQNS